MLTIDLETRASKKLLNTYLANLSAPKNYKDQEKIDEYLKSKKAESEKALATDPDYADIICIGAKEDDQPAKIININEFAQLLEKHKTIITFNGKNFDIPLLIKVGVKNSVELPYRDLRIYCKRWQCEQHVDLMELISDGRDYKSLDEYLQIYLDIKKTPIDFKTCSDEELFAHCIEDVENTYKLFKLFEKTI